MITISAIIPNYNYADFIIERIDSILNQTQPISELIILDDASSDNSVSLIKQKIKEINTRYPSIRTKLIVNKENSGGCVFSQWQKGIREAKGDYIWIAEADDAADEHFLETAAAKLKEHPGAVLFYSDSYRIDQDGKITSETCTDWADMWKNGRWANDYYNSGVDEIINYLSGTNTILNVSSVVWKNTNTLCEIFEEAKNYKIAGDWYIYTRVLENGDIVYSAKPLNRYRKHNKGSASTVTKLMTEYEEMVRVQDRVAEKYRLNKEQREWQLVRRRNMGFVENEKNIAKKGSIAWFVPDCIEGSGGQRTIFQNINRLIEAGYSCDMYVKPLSQNHQLPINIFSDLTKWYGAFYGDIFIEYEPIKEYDMVIATGWETARPVSETRIKNKVYFIQDYEPWFFPMSDDYINARETYSYGLKGISIGKWLAHKIQNDHDSIVQSFSFCADINVYKRTNKGERKKAVCFICQPEKPRRCYALGLKALKIVQEKRPDVAIYLYGSPKQQVHNLNATHLGMLSVEKCNELYNKCCVGLCMSSSNPSRIPFEMMAAGLPVVDLFLENNLYDLPEDGCVLAEPTPEAIASAIIKILDDDGLAKKLSDGGMRYMKNYPLEKGYKEFIARIEELLNDKDIKNKAPKIIYNNKAISSAFGKVEMDESPYLETIIKGTTEEIKKDKKLTIGRRIYLKLRYIFFGW